MDGVNSHCAHRAFPGLKIETWGTQVGTSSIGQRPSMRKSGESARGFANIHRPSARYGQKRGAPPCAAAGRRSWIAGRSLLECFSGGNRFAEVRFGEILDPWFPALATTKNLEDGARGVCGLF